MEPHDGASDEVLFQHFRAGDRESFATLARRHERALLGLALGILDHDRDAAKDAVQDAWVRVVRSAQTFRGNSSVKTWLYRIVINACKDARVRRRVGTDGRIGCGVKEENGAANGQAGESPPDSWVSAAELRSAFTMLAPDRRLILLLCYHQELTHAQAAEVLGIPLGTLKSRLGASLNELRTRLQQEASR